MVLRGRTSECQSCDDRSDDDDVETGVFNFHHNF